jgi:hypothetical protein
MEKIKGLFENINFNAIPHTIFNKIAQLDRNRSYSVSNGVTTYYGLDLPTIMYFTDYNCHILIEHYNGFEDWINKGLINEQNIELKGNNTVIDELLNEYGNGFRKGYNEFESLVKIENNLFSSDNNQIAFKVFSIIDTFGNIGGFTYSMHENKMKITKKLMFESGLKWGQKYKAWEIILNNIPIFEPFFEKFKTSEIIEESIDVSKDLPEIELTTQKEQIRLLYELGVIEFLQNKYPATLNGNNNQISKLISQILRLEQTTIQPTVNALLNNNMNKNYPKESKSIKAIIDKLNSNESI